MTINKILNVLCIVADFILFIPQLIIVNITGLLAAIFGVLAVLLFSLIWMIFFLPMLGLAWLYEKIPFLRIPIGILGIPLALVAYVYISSITHLGEMRAKVLKQFLCLSWPFCLDAQKFVDGKELFGTRYERVYSIASKNKMADMLLDQDFDNRRI